MDTSAWSEQVDAYAQFFRVISLDLRGAGKSEVCEGPYDIASLAGDVRDLVHNLGERRAHISGFSLGGSVAMETAIRTPELVHTLSVHSAKECDELYPHLRNWIQISPSHNFRRERRSELPNPDRKFFQPAIHQ